MCNCLKYLFSEIERAVKMPFNKYRTKRPHEALLDLYIDEEINIVECRREGRNAQACTFRQWNTSLVYF